MITHQYRADAGSDDDPQPPTRCNKGSTRSLAVRLKSGAFTCSKNRAENYFILRTRLENLDHRSVRVFLPDSPVHSELQDSLGSISSEDELAGVYRSSLRVKPERQFSDDAEVRATATDAVEEVSICCLAGEQDGPICDNDSRLVGRVRGKL